jgi:hypothetical protein
MSAPLRDIPILLIDIIDFSKAGSLANQRQLLETLQRLASASGKFFVPYGDPWKKWQRQGTGDGYYLLFDNLDASVALEYPLRLGHARRIRQVVSGGLRAYPVVHPDRIER